MPLYLISYDLHKVRDYKPLYALLLQWKAVRVLESFWFATLTGPAEQIRDIIRARLDGDDHVLVIQLRPGLDWAAFAKLAGVNWLKRNLP
jgi:hypothetical protein